MTTVQYRVTFGKKDETIEGPDDADLVLSIAAVDAVLEPSVAFMRGRLKVVGPTASLIELLRSGEAGRVLARLSQRV